MADDKKQPTETPELGSFTSLFSPPYKYPYEWAPWLMMVAMGPISALVMYALFVLVNLNFWVSIILGILAGAAAGYIYNLYAHSFGWQRIHWIDILLSSNVFR